MSNLVPQVTIFVVFNLIALVTAGGRLFDAVVDPLIANFSDRSNFHLGRRIPFMRAAAVPKAFFAILMFISPYPTEHNFNIFWLALVQYIVLQLRSWKRGYEYLTVLGLLLT